jgi:formylglycine-generating enzyme required for sulfatase activity
MLLRRQVVLALTFCGLTTVAACSAPSQVVLGFATDLSAPTVIDRVEMHVFAIEGQELLSKEWILPGMRARDFKLPGSFTLFSEGGSEPAVRVVLEGHLGADPTPVVSRSASMQFSSEQTLFFRMTLVQRCMGMTCPIGQSCIEGLCKTETVNAVSLRPYEPSRVEAVECNSGSQLIDTSTQEPMVMAGDGFCAVDEWCGESTCYRNQGQGLLWCTPPGSACKGIDGYEDCLVSSCDAQLATCYGPQWRRGHLEGPCKDYGRCRSECACDPACTAACDADRAPACATCLDGPGGVTTCIAGAETLCNDPSCQPIGAGPPDMMLADMAPPDMSKPMLMKPFIPTGIYTLGCTNGDMGTATCSTDEQPLHQVDVGQYYIDATEVTQGEFAACVSAGICLAPVSALYMPATTPTLPVGAVAHAQAAMYCTWKGMQLGVSMGRLPTEAEWEIAAHGVAGSMNEGKIYPFGDTDPTDCAQAIWQYCDNATPVAVGTTHPVGDSAFGIEDLAGNVAEWTSDWYDPGIYMVYQATVPPVMNPTGGMPTSGLKVVRGGSWQSPVADLRAAKRIPHDPNNPLDDIGFRCVFIP